MIKDLTEKYPNENSTQKISSYFLIVNIDLVYIKHPYFPLYQQSIHRY